MSISFPFSVKAYFCLGLFGMPGIVNSIKSALSKGSKILFFILPLFDSPTDSIITFKGKGSLLRVTSTFAAAARRVSSNLGQTWDKACDRLVMTCDKRVFSCDALVIYRSTIMIRQGVPHHHGIRRFQFYRSTIMIFPLACCGLSATYFNSTEVRLWSTLHPHPPKTF